MLGESITKEIEQISALLWNYKEFLKEDFLDLCRGYRLEDEEDMDIFAEELYFIVLVFNDIEEDTNFSANFNNIRKYLKFYWKTKTVDKEKAIELADNFLKKYSNEHLAQTKTYQTLETSLRKIRQIEEISV